ncbi:DMT family transporter [Candidatus Puniceispirillum sp.]|uniref:DMT family transporter n=1 Tax=Candidatus Puniceispirillum sp. TaxID=2026719 RepID=UPI003F697A31
MPAFLLHLWNTPHVVLTLATMMWAAHTIAARISVNEISPMLLMELRWILCLLVLIVFCRKQLISQLPAVKERLGWVFLMGAFGMAGFTVFFILAAQHTTAVNLGITQGSIPAFVMLIGLVVLRTKISLLQICGLALSLAGVVLLVSGGSFSVIKSVQFNVGDLLMLVACLCYAGYTVGLSRRIVMSPVLMLAFFSAAAVVTLTISTAIEYAQGSLVMPGLKGWLIVIYCAIFPSLLAQVLFMRGVELAGSNRAGLYVNLVPVFAALFAVIILGEVMHFYHILSLAFVLGGIYMAERGKKALVQ